MSREERDLVIALALGRIFRLASRSAQPGDVADYERCRAAILDAHEAAGGVYPQTYITNYVRDRNKGAQGD